MTSLAGKTRALLSAGLTALVLGGGTLMTATPAQAQYGYDYGYRRPFERRVIERRVVRPFYGRDCRVVVTRRINRFGERVVVRRRICR